MLMLRRLFNFILAHFVWLTHRTPHADNEHSSDEITDDTENPSDPLPDIVRLEIRDSIDLHTIPPHDIPAVVTEYLHEARRHGFDTVRIIHGKGRGIQRAVVRRILAVTDFVTSYSDAPAYSGGWGATVAHLRISENSDEIAARATCVT